MRSVAWSTLVTSLPEREPVPGALRVLDPYLLTDDLAGLPAGEPPIDRVAQVVTQT